MVLRLNRVVGLPEWFGEWPRPGRPPFIQSEAYRVLLSEMRRYVLEEVTGRSFLISGHRGAGKTTLVQRVIDDLGDELFRRWWNDRFPDGEPLPLVRRPQRPLMVKLHGPSLLADELPRPGGGEKPQTDPPVASGGAAKADKTQPTASSEDNQAQTETQRPDTLPTAKTGTAHGALIQITIALYRALAREFAEAYAIQAREAPGGGIEERLEAAARFRLDLDRAPTAALLRGYWEQLAGDDGAVAHPMQAGIAWPREIGASFSGAKLPDQGAREIVALATAAQAFQVCSGVVKYQQSQKDSTFYERSSESKTGIDPKEAMNRALSLGLGGLLGFGSAGALGLTPTVGIGLGLLGSLAVTASIKRSARQESREDYTFIVDRSIETLERDLPLVIDRVREAGLTPVFLIDELDKLEGNDNGARNGTQDEVEPAQPAPPPGTRKTVTELIRRLKHLTTDFGFFCFLTGPEYFEEVRRKIETQAFPEEHTYFSDRLFVLYTPDELDQFLRSVIVSDAATGSSDAITDDQARRVLARLIVHASRLNTIDVVRALAHDWITDGTYGVPFGTLTYGVPSGTLISQPRYRLIVGVQLTIEHVLRETKLSARIARDPSLRQIAVDTLYMISRVWERSKSEVDLSDGALAKHLLRRRGCSDEMDDEPAISALKAIVDENFDVLTGALRNLATMLCDFQATRAALSVAGRLDDLSLATLASGSTPFGLLNPPPEGSSLYRFRYDFDGNEISIASEAVRREPAPSPSTTEAVTQETAPQPLSIDELVTFAREVLRTMDDLGLTLSNLIDVGILAPGLSQGEIVRVIDRLSVAAPGASSTDGTTADVLVLRDLAAAFSDRSALIEWSVELARDIAIDVDDSPRTPLADVLRAMERFIDFNSLVEERVITKLNARVEARRLEGRRTRLAQPRLMVSGDAVKAWREHLARQARSVRPLVSLDQLVAEAWIRWEVPVRRLFNSVRTHGRRISVVSEARVVYADLVLAAASRLPSRAMRRNVALLTPFDWSDMTLAGTIPPFFDPLNRPPHWSLLVGLRQLGFARDLLLRLLHERTVPVEGDWRYSVAESAPAGESGILVIIRDDTEPLDGAGSGTHLFIRESWIQDYAGGVIQLADRAAFRMVIDER